MCIRDRSRGGDQVAVKRYGESVKYYGGTSEAQEKHSRVRVRVMAQAIKEAILDADKVFIVGHKEMDFDCMGSALAVSYTHLGLALHVLIARFTPIKTIFLTGHMLWWFPFIFVAAGVEGGMSGIPLIAFGAITSALYWSCLLYTSHRLLHLGGVQKQKGHDAEQYGKDYQISLFLQIFRNLHI